MSAEESVQKLLTAADVELNGSRPWDLQVLNNKLFDRLLAGGSLALGESYMDGWWEDQALDQFFSHILAAQLDKKVSYGWRFILQVLQAKLFNNQNLKLAAGNAESHYDLGNDLYTAMLDKRLVYTCGYWPQAQNLDQAQEAKLDLVCRKIGLRAGQRVLDIGCGWGSWAKFAAERYGAQVVGITLAPEQVELGNKLCAGLPVEIILQDYRKITGTFDHIISLGMFEHVGYKNYRTYMQIVRDHLAPDGLFLLHTIAGNTSATTTDPWINKYIFPNGMLPSAKQITTATEGLFVIEDWHNFGHDYDQTLMAWWQNFNSHWPELQAKYGERFYRRWKYYLLSCAASFRVSNNQLWQIVLSQRGTPGGYKSIR
ncbi:MAG: cyclopropane fatty acyl phospholipid synthase [Candidatus Komeilibacteria bacterium]